MEAIAERVEETANPVEMVLNDSPPIKPRSKAPPFNSQTAREMGLKSAAVRKQRREERLRALREEETSPAGNEEFAKERLLRTREQLRQLDKDLADADDPKAIKALCDSIKALSEVERILAGRPLPGSHRPTRNPKRESPVSFTPTE